MKKLLFFLLISISFEKSSAENLSKVYFAGGCFWCMEESFDKIEGVKKTISGYSGGHVKNPKYRDVIKNTTGHYETLEITYNPSEINFSKLLEVYWVNIDPFDINGQFCDKGESYKSVIFYSNDKEKKIVEESIKRIEKRFNKKVVTYIKRFKEFYKAETYHQDYYEKNFIRYLLYKKNCQREEILNNIWR